MEQETKNFSNIDKSQIPVVILCGGRGTRLKEETEVIPKPLVKIGEYPILWHIMKIYQFFGFTKFILPVGYKGEKIKEYFYNYPILHSDFTIDLDSSKEKKIIFHDSHLENWQVTIVDTGLDAGTGARVKRVEKFIKNPLFMLTYGDGVANVKLDDLVSFHLRQGKTVTVTGVKPPARFGSLRVDGDRVIGFKEKPQVEVGYINGGFFVMKKDIFELLSDKEPLSLESDVLPKIAQKEQLAIFRHDGYWQCMDTLRDVEFLNEEWESGRAPWKIWS